MSAIDQLRELDAVARLSAKDASLFSDDAGVRDSVDARLGWVGLSAQSAASLPLVHEIAEGARAQGVTDVILLGMGGSSLASLVISAMLGDSEPRLHVLDTVSPATIGDTLATIDPAKTIYVVASKSGGTIEPNSLYTIFRSHADKALGLSAGSRFIAITDPGTSLELLANESGFGAVVSTPQDVGGRFSALTPFGLVPAALIGVDVDRMLSVAAAAEARCEAAYDSNPAVELAAFLADARTSGADKLTLVANGPLRTFGVWVEQLVAESLGKNGTGIVPVVELAEVPAGYGRDRAIVAIRMTGDTRLAEWAQSQRGLHPVHEIVLDDAYDIAEQFVTFEYAIALLGILMGVNPFDEPNVAEAKAATAAVLDGRQHAPAAQFTADDVGITFAGALPDPGHSEHSVATAVGHALAAMGPGDYLAVLAYLPDDDAMLRQLHEPAASLSRASGCPVCLEVGPRYLHSTGQLHKGGPNNGVFIIVTTSDQRDVKVPGQTWTLRALHLAQAEGDLMTLAAHGRRVLRLDLPDASAASIAWLAQAFSDAAGLRSAG